TQARELLMPDVLQRAKDPELRGRTSDPENHANALMALQPALVAKHRMAMKLDAVLVSIAVEEPDEFEGGAVLLGILDDLQDLAGEATRPPYGQRLAAHAATPLNSCIVASPSAEMPSLTRTFFTVPMRISASRARDQSSTYSR